MLIEIADRLYAVIGAMREAKEQPVSGCAAALLAIADEVGLRRTIEAGLVLAQNCAEGKRRIIVICPANLRKRLPGGSFFRQ